MSVFGICCDTPLICVGQDENVDKKPQNARQSNGEADPFERHHVDWRHRAPTEKSRRGPRFSTHLNRAPPPDDDDEDDGDDDDDDGQTSSEEGSEEESDADEIEGAEEAKGKFDIDDADDPEMSKPDISKTARKSRLTVAPRSGSAAVSTASASAPPPPDSGRGRNVSYAVSCEVLQVRGWCATEKVRRTTPESAERPRHLNAAPPDCHANR